ncbi:unnamed protein product [Paramecium sonneborni]|uniref:Uncharacterized protein n=1 Tax=Paramecium sonneborni TaxID=65129 RepID=A0A8S1L632_9CILI|nr:unnamed protein product [Paramecium sonneborni]
MNNVGLLVSALFDRFKNLEFFNSFYKAINEISQYPEQKVLLSQKITRTSTVQYSKQLLESIILVKKFASQYLFQLFQLGCELDINLEEQAIIFLKFLKNTREESFITEIIEILQNIKQNIFRNSLWSIGLEDQIEQLLYDIASTNSKKIETTLNYDDSDTEQSEIDMHEVIEGWICQDEQGYFKQQLVYFRNDVYFEFIMKLVFDLLNSQPIPQWFSILQIENDELNDCRMWKSETQKLDPVYNYRSKKVLKIITNDKNFAIITKQVPQLLMKICKSYFQLVYMIYESLKDYERTINLQHIGQLIDYLFLQSPKSQNISSQEFKFKDLDNINEFAKQRNQNHSKFQFNSQDQKFKRQKTIVEIIIIHLVLKIKYYVLQNQVFQLLINSKQNILLIRTVKPYLNQIQHQNRINGLTYYLYFQKINHI